MDPLESMHKKAARFSETGAKYSWVVRIDTIATEHLASVVCKATRGQETINIWWENDSLGEAPTYQLGGRFVKLRNASAALQQMAKMPNFEQAARVSRAKQQRGEDVLNLEPAPETLPWVYLLDPKSPHYTDGVCTDADILRECYAKTIVYRNKTTGEVATDVVIRSSNAQLKKGNFNSNIYHISRSSEGREILNFLGVFGFRAVALDSILRVGSSQEAAEKTRKHLIALAAEAEKGRQKK